MKKSKKPARKAAAKKAPARRRAKKASPVPKGFRTVTPYLVVRNGAQAIDFYKKALGAKELMRMPMEDGRVAHAELQIGDSRVMLGDEQPERGASAPQTVGGSSVHIFLYLKDVDGAFARAIAAGATAEMPPTDMFWGDRYAKLSDPYGHKWNMATHVEDVSPKEMGRRAAEAAAQQQG
jgi:PhnB protein